MRYLAVIAVLSLIAGVGAARAAEKNAPVIEVPAQIELSDGVLQLKGRIRDESRVVFATLDGQPIAVGPEGAIVLRKNVAAGAAEAVVTALDEWGNRSERAIRLLRPQAKPDLAFGTYHAVVIGNNDYAQLTKLKTAVSDATAVAALLKDAYGFDTTLLTNATRGDVIGALSKLRGKLKPSDNLLIYFAGHGVLDSYAEEGFWLPVDAAKDNPANWISNADITNMLRAIRAKHVMVVADSCFSGTLVRAAPVKIKTSAGPDTTAVISFSCGARQPVWPRPGPAWRRLETVPRPRQRHRRLPIAKSSWPFGIRSRPARRRPNTGPIWSSIPVVPSPRWLANASRRSPNRRPSRWPGPRRWPARRPLSVRRASVSTVPGGRRCSPTSQPPAVPWTIISMCASATAS